MSYQIRTFQIIVTIFVLLSFINSCEPPDCDRPDCGSCANSCCNLNFYVRKLKDFNSIKNVSSS